MANLPHCPNPPPDTDAAVLQAYQKGTEPLTIAEFDKWIETARNDAPTLKGKDRVQQEMTGRKIEHWFSNRPEKCAKWENQKVSFDELEKIANSIPAPKVTKKYEIKWRDDIRNVKIQLFELEEDKATECSKCGMWAASLTCRQCHKQKYCCRTCQREDWKEHKKTCHVAEEK